MIYGIEVGVICWALNGKDVGKKMAIPGDGMQPVVIVIEADHKPHRKFKPRANWLDTRRLMLRGRK